MSSQRSPWQICSGPRRLQPRCCAGIPCNAHLAKGISRRILLLTKRAASEKEIQTTFLPRCQRERSASAPTAWTQQRIFVPLPAPAGQLAGFGGQQEP